MTFNGEIFNFREVSQTLEDQGIRVPNRTRTPRLFWPRISHGGAECVHQFNGMWAFALYEGDRANSFCREIASEKSRCITASRDGKLIFASEIKAILAHPIRRRANREVVSDYLYKGEAQRKARVVLRRHSDAPAGAQRGLRSCERAD